jgi:hypothetical protein
MNLQWSQQNDSKNNVMLMDRSNQGTNRTANRIEAKQRNQQNARKKLWQWVKVRKEQGEGHKKRSIEQYLKRLSMDGSYNRFSRMAEKPLFFMPFCFFLPNFNPLPMFFF